MKLAAGHVEPCWHGKFIWWRWVP